MSVLRGWSGLRSSLFVFNVGSDARSAILLLGIQVQYPESAGILSLLREVSASGEAACFRAQDAFSLHSPAQLEHVSPRASPSFLCSLGQSHARLPSLVRLRSTSTHEEANAFKCIASVELKFPDRTPLRTQHTRAHNQPSKLSPR